MLNVQCSMFNPKVIQVVIVAGFHLFPFRTEKLSPPAPMVLHTRGRVGSRRLFGSPESKSSSGFCCLYKERDVGLFYGADGDFVRLMGLMELIYFPQNKKCREMAFYVEKSLYLCAK